MRVLGIHSVSPVQDDEEMDPWWSYHDAAAVLVEDGKVLAAIEEERLHRIKHSSAFPARAIRWCLEEAGFGLRDVDRIAIDLTEAYVGRYFLRRALDNASLPLASGRQAVAALFERGFNADVRDRLRFVQHHRAHLWSAVIPSGFKRALAVSIDGSGDKLSGAVGTFDGSELRVLREYPVRQSLGYFYRECIAVVGYTRFDEYKVMGLAPYGDPARFADLFAQLYRLLPDGEYELVRGDALIRVLELCGLTQQARRKGEPFAQPHRDFAAALQQALERIVLHVLEHYRRTTGERQLCLAGGVAHNCSLNGKIAYSGLFDDVWVQPAAHDAGNALGAALAVLHDERVALKPTRMQQVYFGTKLRDDSVEAGLRAWSDLVTFERSSDVIEQTAELLANGLVVGWAQGRSEFGPRALGNRSILADPRPAENKDRINAMVKKREAYRPFAPSILEERVGDYFELPNKTTDYPFMTFALRVQKPMRPLLGAITHVDGTARLQTVSRAANPRYWALLKAFEQKTGIPILLNTSFNNHAEPIVDSLDEAVTCYLTTGLDVLIIGEYVVRKRNTEAGALHYRGLCPVLPCTRSLRLRVSSAGTREFALHSTVSRHFGEKTVSISAEAYAVLQCADGQRALGEILPGLDLADGARAQRVLEEIIDLWSRRIVSCTCRVLPRTMGRTLTPAQAAAS